ncbi:putative ABC transport system permease protein [Granulicella rosea]|uniref:Putative ABC transport system permease protein n=1 Tax=Granulicella rosea TaxID=474952 RepID=A0A239MKA0_9BACT|nr:ABC transporter permease [Granulicella rosea]SNT43085.1 putative ABC transport system permease protein [Granulicella rosea]
MAQVKHQWGIAIRALKKNKLQTALTMVGMTIGVATVLTMIALGSGAQQAIQDQVRSAGMNLLVVTSGNYNVKVELGTADGVEGPSASAAAYEPFLHKPVFRPATYDPRMRPHLMRVQSVPGVNADPTVIVNKDSGTMTGPGRLMPRPGDSAAGMGAATTLTMDDAAEMRKLEGVQYVSSGIHENQIIENGSNSYVTSMHGDDTTMASIRRGWVFPYGGFFSKREEKNAANVIVLGQIASEKLFGANVDPTGKSVMVRGVSFKVEGVIGSGSWMVRPTAGDDQFDAVYVPVTTMQKLMKRDYLSTITVTTKSTGDVTRVSKQIIALLRQRHHIGMADPDDFGVNSEARKVLSKGGMRPEVARSVVGNVSGFEKVTLDQLGKTLDQASATMTALLTSIAAVSLLVGGIGIMNIMLLSVSQRTREIGIRRAVGAQAADVLAQFLLEAITLSVAGGLLGIVIGCIVSGSLSQMVQWSTRISLPAILVSFLISAGIGIFFGYYPARQASQILPIDSLRFE